jgi:ubiquinone/menaquinone biosynthesis C-methylase UbiE
MSLRAIYYKLTPDMRLLVRKFYYLPSDIYLRITGKKKNMVPDKGDIYIGSGDFIKQGIHHLDLLKRHTNLKHDSAILDIGCGIGRSAAALTKYLNSHGSYEGFDVVKKGINWCNKNISNNYTNFHFRHVPLKNDLYNKNGNNADEFIFPYNDSLFDVVFLFSVFTHMQQTEIKHYLNEIFRVMKVGGNCLATFFIYNEKDEEYISQYNSFCFPVKREGFRLMDKKVKSANVAFEEKNLQNIISDSGLKIKKVVAGYWKNTGNKNELNDFQDIIVMEK